MYFGAGDRSRSIHLITAFITGFNTGFAFGQQSPHDTDDLGFFTEWVATRYRVLAESRSGFCMILEHVGGDEQKAFDEFFRLLPDFLCDKQQFGTDGILSRFSDVQDEAFRAFEKELENK